MAKKKRNIQKIFRLLNIEKRYYPTYESSGQLGKSFKKFTRLKSYHIGESNSTVESRIGES